MSDTASPRTRERVWIEKFDKTTEPPRLIETIFVEDGRIVSVTPAPKQEEETRDGSTTTDSTS